MLTLKTLDQVRDHLGNVVVPFEVPIGEAENFKGVVNIVDMKAREKKGQGYVEVDIPSGMESEIEPYREMIIEAVAQTSEELMEKYFEGEELTPEEIKQGLKKGVLDGELIPVICGSSTQNIGIDTLMNVVINYLPSPEEGRVAEGENPKNNEKIERHHKDSEPFSAIVFKTIADPYVGKLSLFKVVSGTLTADGEIYNANKEKKEKLSHLYILRARSR